MEKQIFETGLGDVNITELGCAMRNRADDPRDQRAASVGIEVHIVTVRANFRHAWQSFEPFNHLGRTPAKMQPQQISSRDGCLQLRRRTQRNHVPVIHDGDTMAECVRLFHVVGREQNGLTAAIVLTNDFPQQQFRLRIESRAGLVQKKHFWPVQQRSD